MVTRSLTGVMPLIGEIEPMVLLIFLAARQSSSEVCMSSVVKSLMLL